MPTDRTHKVTMHLIATHEDAPAPSVATCRYAVLTIVVKGRASYVIYDRLTNRVVDGVFGTTADDTLYVAGAYNRDWLADPSQDPGEGIRSPNGIALGLAYPDAAHMRTPQERERDWEDARVREAEGDDETDDDEGKDGD